MIRYVDPTTIRLEGYDDRRSQLEKHLTYHDKKVDFELSKAKNSRWLLSKLGEEGFREHLEDLKSQRFKNLVFEDRQGLWTYSGLAERLAGIFKDEIAYPEARFPESKLLPWNKEPAKKPRPYQLEAAEALLKHGHAGVEIGTGLGKSFIIQMLIKRIGLKTVVMAPSVSIASQLYKEIEHHFGKKYVGFYGDGKKEAKKLITIAIAASLTKVEKDSPAWEELSKTQVFIADESHLTPATTLQHVCFGLLRTAPYRFFFSGTQMRNDGLDLVLEAISGPIVYRMDVRQGVDQGYLSKPRFFMVNCQSDSQFYSKDANEMTRAHLYYNPKVNKIAADIANRSVSLMKRPTLILVEEIEQFTHLLPHLQHKAAFAHGGVNKDNKDKLPAEYHKSDPNALVKDFNEGKIPILVGTSCVSIGTDIQAVGQIIYLMGGKSEIQLKQAIGRGTRLFPGKTDCIFTDFCVENMDVLARHAYARSEIYSDVYDSPTRIDMS